MQQSALALAWMLRLFRVGDNAAAAWSCRRFGGGGLLSIGLGAVPACAAASGPRGVRPTSRANQHWAPCGSSSSSYMAAATPIPDGEKKPFFAAVGNGDDDGSSRTSAPVPPSSNDWSALTVAKLRGELKVRGLPLSGTKAALVARLQKHEAQGDGTPGRSIGAAKLVGAPLKIPSRSRGGRSVPTAAPLRARTKPRRLPADGAKGGLAGRRSDGEAKGKSGGIGGTGDAAPIMTAAPYGGRTVAALRALLRQRQLPVSGTKAGLISRLEASDAASNAGGNASRWEGGSRPSATSAPTKYPSDLIVVLDMDRCLVDSHVSYEEETSEEFIERLLDGGWEGEAWINQDVAHWRFPVTDHVEAYVTPRPGVVEFLRNVTGRFETHVFTSSVDVYADKVLDRLDPDGALAGRWYSTHTVEFGNSQIKDLTLLFPKRGLGRVVLVDDSTFSMIMNPANGIPVPSYLGLDSNDGELEKVWQLLRELDGVPDVRPILQEKFGVAKEWESYLGMFRGEIEELLQWKERQLRELKEQEGDEALK
jgi:Dullard-like phosphatase family protein